METRPFGRTGLWVSALGVGTAEIGFENSSDRTVSTVLEVALDLGLNVIDTAAMYGAAEEKIGRALQGKRTHHLLFTKCGRCLPPRYSWAGFGARSSSRLHHLRGGSWDSPAWHPYALEWNIEQSLRRLRTDWLDLILLHSCSLETLQQGEVIETLEKARRAGKVRHIGYSGDGPAALYAVECGRFDALETSVNVADVSALDTLVPLAHQRQMGVIAKRPIANGVWRATEKPKLDNQVEYWRRLRELHYEFLQSGRALEIALRFTVGCGVDTAVVGTTNPEHLRQDAKFAAAGQLATEEFNAIRERWNQVARPDWTGQT